MSKLLFLLLLWGCKLLNFLCAHVIHKGGSAISGKVACRLQKDFVRHFRGIDPEKTVFVTGTNGKTSTTNMLAYVMKSAGLSVATNGEGANMLTGVATTLIKNSTLTGRFTKDYLVLEIDERSFPIIYKYVPARHMGFTNLQKDQVQRNGDPDFILRKFQGAITKNMTLYLNNEEPRSRSLEEFCGKVCYFSVSDNPKTYRRTDFYDVTMPCPKCGHPIAFDRFNLAHIGPFSCGHCGYASAEEVQVRIDAVDFEGKTFTHNGSLWPIQYTDPFYIYNYAMVIGICRHYGLTDEQMKKAFDSFENPAAHNNVIRYHGKEIHYLRAKQENPEALQSQLDIAAADKRRKVFLIGLYKVMDFDPHYAGTFYFSDCDFTPVVESGVEHYIAFSADVCHDLALRMIMAGADENRLTIVDSDEPEEIFRSLDSFDSEVVYLITNPKHSGRNIAYLKQGGAGNA